MKKTLYVLPVVFTLTACFEKENPLLKIEPYKVQAWISQNVVEEVKNCSAVWAEPEQSKALLPTCEPMQKAVADKMNSTGLSNAEITPKDILLPAVWKTYVTAQKQQVAAEQRIRERKLERQKCFKIQNGPQARACMDKVRLDGR